MTWRAGCLVVLLVVCARGGDPDDPRPGPVHVADNEDPHAPTNVVLFAVDGAPLGCQPGAAAGAHTAGMRRVTLEGSLQIYGDDVWELLLQADSGHLVRVMQPPCEAGTASQALAVGTGARVLAKRLARFLDRRVRVTAWVPAWPAAGVSGTAGGNGGVARLENVSLVPLSEGDNARRQARRAAVLEHALIGKNHRDNKVLFVNVKFAGDSHPPDADVERCATWARAHGRQVLEWPVHACAKAAASDPPATPPTHTHTHTPHVPPAPPWLREAALTRFVATAPRRHATLPS